MTEENKLYLFIRMDAESVARIVFVSEESTAYLLEELEGVTQNIFNLFRRYDIASVLGSSEAKMNEPMSKLALISSASLLNF